MPSPSPVWPFGAQGRVAEVGAERHRSPTSPSRRVGRRCISASNASGRIHRRRGAHREALVGRSSEPAGASKATSSSASRTSRHRQPAARERHLIDVDAEDLARDRRRSARRRRPAPRSAGPRSRPRPASVSSSTDIVDEVTPTRMTASALASALTMRGSSASSGSWLMTRAIASRASDRGDVEIGRRRRTRG